MRSLIFATLAVVGLAGAASATDLGAMTTEERDTFRAEVRAYLLDNPEVLMEAIAVLEQRQAAQQATAERDLVAANAADLFEDGASWVGGNPDGDVTIVEFLDYRCSFCRRAQPEVEELIASDGNIRFIVKEYPILGDDSRAASRFAISTLMLEGPEAYKKVHDDLMAARTSMTPDALRRVAESHNLDAEAILGKMDSDEVTAIIARNHALADRLNISGTPTFVFGQDLVRGYVPIGAMQQLVNAIRAEG